MRIGDVDSGQDFKLYLIDLHRVQIREKVPHRWRVKDLAGLFVLRRKCRAIAEGYFSVFKEIFLQLDSSQLNIYQLVESFFRLLLHS